MNSKNSGKRFLWLFLAWILITSCGQTHQTETMPSLTALPDINGTSPALAAESTFPPVTPTSLPPTLNPLTGLNVADPSLLELPAVLVSISTFPVTARPQAGPSFAPFVFEIYITEGTTRYLTAFYGEFPAPEVPLTGSCSVRREPFIQNGLILGNRVWLDSNQNNLQDDWERGVGGVCVNLYDAQHNLLQQTSTDSNGWYGFNVNPGTYFVAFEKPAGMEFVQKDAGDESKDGDVDSASGWSDALDVSAPLLDLDLGLILHEQPPPASDLPPARVGPVRSGRLVYADIAEFFAGSCLIYAYASAEVLVELPKCSFVDHNIQGGGYMLDISRMRELAEARRDPQTAAKYANNLFSAEPPQGGAPAARLDVFIAWLNQSGWVYDPLSQSYWRYVDDGGEATAGILHPEVERLTGRQLQFENVIILFTEHDVISPTNLDIHLERGLSGKALLFRDGQMYTIEWNTEDAGPIKFQYKDNHPFPLKPGHTWVTVVTPETTVTERRPGEWYLRFSQPPGAK
ncbi:MAG: SdrD B-like domain-containing protein [Chloroflexota bacterium]